ncbi:tetratricopeptide repeat protein [Streptomyces sp. NPDC006655]|uniref:tetratricopeptide repeat protein n=1 Tax=Streptomyces sp. NPDC006655 TaxID=3156898 RepID=UPI003456018D
MHGQDWIERAAELYERPGDASGEAEALFWVGCRHQVVKGDGATGRPYFERSYARAKSVGDRMTMSCAIRHLGFADKDAGHFDLARERLTESVTLRREIGFRPGEAAGLVALAHLAAETGDPSAAYHHLDEAASVAESCGAKAVSGWIEEARAHIRSQGPWESAGHSRSLRTATQRVDQCPGGFTRWRRPLPCGRP